MARITVSLPDELKTQLDEYAQLHGKNTSEVVQLALKSLFAPAPQPQPSLPPVPSPPPAPHPDTQPDPRFKRLEDYLAAIAYQAEHMRQGLWALSHRTGIPAPCPSAIPPPPWPNQPPPGWSFPAFATREPTPEPPSFPVTWSVRPR